MSADAVEYLRSHPQTRQVPGFGLAALPPVFARVTVFPGFAAASFLLAFSSAAARSGRSIAFTSTFSRAAAANSAFRLPPSAPA